MIWQQTLEKINRMKFFGMLVAIKEQESNRQYEKMSFEDRLGYLVEREYLDRENRRLKSRLTQANFRQQTCVENIKFSSGRNLSKTKILDLGKCHWIKEHKNLIITGPTGAGKSYLVCALGHSACLNGYKVSYRRTSRLLMELSVGRGDGRYEKLLKSFSKTDLLILDDFGLSKLNDVERQDLLEIVEDRYEVRSTAIIGQLPVEKWHEIVGNSTVADAILDRVVHNSFRVDLHGSESMRKRKMKEATA